MKVVAYDPFLSPERAVEMGVEKVELDELLARADFITLHTPLTDKTRNILSAENLAKTKKGVLIINCARGGLVDEAALRAGAGQRPHRRRGLRRLRRRAGQGKRAVRRAELRRHPAPGRLDQRGPGERRPAGRRADQRLPADRRGHQRAEQPLGHRRGGAAS